MTADVGEFFEDTKRKTTRGARAVKDRATAITPETVLNLIGQLGLTDLVMSRVRERIKETDVDDLLDDAIGYLKRNPEVLVALLAVTTMAAGVVLFLKTRDDWDLDDYLDDDDDRGRGKRGFNDVAAASPGRAPGRKTSRSTR
jgi:hypothetical protein